MIRSRERARRRTALPAPPARAIVTAMTATDRPGEWAMPELPAPPTDHGRLGPRSLFWDVYRYWRPVHIGGLAATIVALLYPPMALALIAETRATGARVDP